jgi:hypothetical protein
MVSIDRLFVIQQLESVELTPHVRVFRIQPIQIENILPELMLFNI